MGNSMNAVKSAPTVAASQTPRKIMVGPGVHVTLPPSKVRSTKLGQVAQRLADQAQVTALSIAATSGYVNALCTTASPAITFSDVPPGMTSSLAQLQAAYNGFTSQYAIFQGQASLWIRSAPGSGTPTILSQLTAVPATFSFMESTIDLDFTGLANNPVGSAPYNAALSQLQMNLSSCTQSVQGLNTSMSKLGTNLETATSNLITSANTGTLSQLQAAYQTDITALQTAITNANNTISSDNQKIIGEGVGAAVSVGVATVGLLNWWNPIGWIMMGAGAVGAYFSIEEIESLKAQIAILKTQISTDENFETTDQAAATTLAAFCTQMLGFASMNQAAQVELTQLENLLSTITSDIATSVADANANEITAAQAEWATVVSEAAFLGTFTAYVWPGPLELSAPSMFAPVGNDIYAIATSGSMYHYSGSANSWSPMNVTSLSVVGVGSMLVAIDGAPLNGTAEGPSPAAATYFVKTYNISSGTWSTISTFPVTAVATDGSKIYAINQTQTDMQVYVYTGNGTSWTALPQLPGPDAAIQIACANRALFALTNNSQFVYQYNPTTNAWTQIGTGAYAAIEGNGIYLAMIDINNVNWLYTPASASFLKAGWSTLQVAQYPSSLQLTINNAQNLYLADTLNNPATYTQLATNATAVFISDTGVSYYADNMGNLYSITISGAQTQLPAMP
jgi:hypothetical protein